MSFEARLKSAHREMDEAEGCKGKDGLVEVLCRKLGLKARPALYSSFRSNFFMFGACFAVGWLSIDFLLGRHREEAAIYFLSKFLTSFVCFGFLMARRVERMAKKYKLSKWEELPLQ